MASAHAPAIQIKGVYVLAPWLDPTLVELLEWLHGWFPPPMMVTSAWRPDDPGIHSTRPLRAVDLRSHHIPDAVARQVEERINRAWIYDPRRPEKRVCLWHDVGLGVHFHLQVHPRNHRREEVR